MTSTVARKAALAIVMTVFIAAMTGCSSSGKDSTPAPTDPQAIAAAADKIKDTTSLALGKVDSAGNSITGWLYHVQARTSGSKYAATWQSYRGGGAWNITLPWYDEDGKLLIASVTSANRPLQSDPDLWPFWTIDLSLSDVEGIRTSPPDPISNHGLGAAWQGVEAMRTYEGGGTLTLRLFTDLTQPDNPGYPYVSHPANDATYPNVILDDTPVPAIPAGWDAIWIFPVNGRRGSLDGVAGTFSCASGDIGYCGLVTARQSLTPGYYPDVAGDPVIFTPDDGSGEEMLAHPQPTEVPTVNYLTLGNWMFVPEDIADLDAYNFGVFAGGDDPFRVNNLQGLAGTAAYEGEAAGMYAESGEEAMISPFNAKAELMADFGTADDFGAIVGRVYDFNIDGGKTSPLTELTLRTVSWRGDGTINIFQSWSRREGDPVPGRGREGVPVPGGWIEGDTAAADGGWQGRWGGKFFGNGDAADDLPMSFAGTFGATDGNHSFAGSFFGAHKQP